MNVLYNPTTVSDICVDLYHGNTLTNPTSDFQTAIDAGIMLFILKATQNINYTDPEYNTRMSILEKMNVRRAAYHYLATTDGVAEANYFLSIVGDTTGLGIMLDLEDHTTNINAAVDWVNTIQNKTGRTPLIYVGAYYVGCDGSQFPDATLNACPLMVPEYGNTPYCPPGWTEWMLHQYTDGSVIPNPVPGLGKVDRSKFAGTTSQFTTWWDSLI